MFETVQMAEVGETTSLIMHHVHHYALGFMALVYALKIWWILKRKPAKERTPARGDHGKGIRYSFMLIAMPWEIESQRKTPLRWIEFAIFHIGVAVAIAGTFTLSIAPQIISHNLTIWIMQGMLILALAAGLNRMFRRIALPHMRAISSPDDYFSIVMLNVWLGSAVWGVMQTSELALLIYFSMTTFFLITVPFTKISHYIFWPFIRFYIGKHLAHRGVFPRKVVKEGTS